MKQFIVGLCLLGATSLYAQQPVCGNKGQVLPKTLSVGNNSRSDTLNVLNYDINLNITDYTNRIIRGSCGVQFTPKMNGVTTMTLDLLMLTIDSIKLGGQAVPYYYNQKSVTATFPTALNINDTMALRVWYRGVPQGDATGWGGFYFQSPYAYNLGVGFGADPHTYGRVWFPCFDNFVERSTYTFTITTPLDKYAHCNGYLVSETSNGSTNTAVWRLEQPIPTYLACVAIADYTTVHQHYTSTTGQVIPIELVGRAADTTNLKSSFVNLNSALACFESWYGPYRWSKVGYSLVPFNSGAMEHATNIAYPRFAANGNLSNETLFAHELSHHWWGDLATCTTAEDMWLNEGWASYSEHLFTEAVYGSDAYLDAVKNNWLSVMKTAHIDDGGYLAVSGIGHAYTYGTTVYHKGAGVAYALRGYLGDTNFRSSIQTVLNQTQFKNHSSAEFRDALTAASGTDMTDFFNDWVFQPGFTAVEIDSFKAVPNGTGAYTITVYLEQKRHHADHLYENMPVRVQAVKTGQPPLVATLNVSGQYSTAQFTASFVPDYLRPNYRYALTLAEMQDESVVTTSHNFTRELVNLFDVAGTGEFQAVHRWVAPDPVLNTALNYRLSNNHYWDIRNLNNVYAKANIPYDKRQSAAALDADLVSVTEDSLILLYRADASHDWTEYPYYTKNTGGSTVNGYGSVNIDSLKTGQYCFANGVHGLTSVTQPSHTNNIIVKVQPNPTTSSFRLSLEDDNAFLSSVELYNIQGELLELDTDCTGQQSCELSLSNAPAGVYIVRVYLFSGQVLTKKVVKG